MGKRDHGCPLLLSGVPRAMQPQTQLPDVLQVVDETRGPTTKRNYAIFKVPSGDELQGAAVDFVGRPLDGAAPARQDQLGPSALTPLFNREIPMDGREQIAEALVTGVKVRRPSQSLQAADALRRGEVSGLIGLPLCGLLRCWATGVVVLPQKVAGADRGK